MSLKALYNKCTLSALKPNGRQAMESPEILDFVVRNPDMFCSDAQRNFYSKKKKDSEKPTQSHAFHFVRQLMKLTSVPKFEISSVLNPQLTVWRKECNFSFMKFSSHSI